MSVVTAANSQLNVCFSRAVVAVLTHTPSDETADFMAAASSILGSYY